MRARLALAVAGVDVEVREIALRNKPDVFLALSPKATVPVLSLHGGHVLEESLDIMQWALRLHDPIHWLRDLDAAIARVSSIDGEFKTHLDRYKYANRYKDADPRAERDAADACLQPLEARLCVHDHVGGDRPDLADAAIFPFVRQFANVEPERFSERFPQLDRWRKAWQATSSFQAIMRKLPPWQADDAPVYFREVYACTNDAV